MTELKMWLEEFKGRFEHTKERVSEFEARTMKIIKSEKHKERRLKKTEPNVCIVGAPEEERKRKTEHMKK